MGASGRASNAAINQSRVRVSELGIFHGYSGSEASAALVDRAIASRAPNEDAFVAARRIRAFARLQLAVSAEPEMRVIQHAHNYASAQCHHRPSPLPVHIRGKAECKTKGERLDAGEDESAANKSSR